MQARVLGPNDGKSVELAAIGVRFMVGGDEPARRLEIISPAGFERYFEEMSELTQRGPPDPSRAAGVAARYGFELDLDSIPRLLEQHGLRLR